LIEIGGCSLLEWQLRSLAVAGIDRVLVVGGYRSELLCGDYGVVRNERWASTGVVATLANAQDWLSQQDCVVSYSDIVYHPAHVRHLCASEGDIAITYDQSWEALWNERFQTPLLDAETFLQNDGWLTAIGARAEAITEIKGQFMGLLRMTPRGSSQMLECWRRLREVECDQLDMTALLSLLLRENVPVRAVAVTGRWCEVDTRDDLDVYRRRIAAADAGAERWLHDWRVDWNCL
jgi:choline kinase